MSEKRCETCKHWLQHRNGPHRYDEGNCERITPTTTGDGEATIYAWADEPAWLETHKHFGCLLWEQR